MKKVGQNYTWFICTTWLTWAVVIGNLLPTVSLFATVACDALLC